MPELPSFFNNSLWLFIICTGVSVLFIYLWLRGKKNYSVDDAESHAEEYANIIKEGHGGMTIFLWIGFGLIIGWCVWFLATHWTQFWVISALAS